MHHPRDSRRAAVLRPRRAAERPTNSRRLGGVVGEPLMGDAAPPDEREQKKNMGACKRSNLLDSCHAASDSEPRHLLKGGRRSGGGGDKRPPIATQSITLGSADGKLHSALFCTSGRGDQGAIKSTPSVKETSRSLFLIGI